MDKNLNNLDPKLKEAYDRVMGTNFTPPTKPQAPQQGPLMQTQPVPESFNNKEDTPEFNPAPAQPLSSFMQEEQNPAKKKMNFLPILFVIGGIAFLAVYAVIWAKIFGLF